MVKEYDGGYDDWLRQRPEPTESAKPAKAADSRPKTKPASATGKRKLKYKEKIELESLPARIEELESFIGELHEAMAKPEFYQQAGELIAAEQNRLAEYEAQLQETYERWEELEELA